MMWWFLIFACGAGAALWAGIAAYLRVRRHMRISAASGNAASGNKDERR